MGLLLLHLTVFGIAAAFSIAVWLIERAMPVAMTAYRLLLSRRRSMAGSTVSVAGQTLQMPGRTRSAVVFSDQSSLSSSPSDGR